MRARLLLYLYLGLKFEQKSEVGKTDVVYSWGGAVPGPGCTHGHCCQARPGQAASTHHNNTTQISRSSAQHREHESLAAGCSARLLLHVPGGWWRVTEHNAAVPWYAMYVAL